jgi:hypothetical protein
MVEEARMVTLAPEILDIATGVIAVYAIGIIVSTVALVILTRQQRWHTRRRHD